VDNRAAYNAYLALQFIPTGNPIASDRLGGSNSGSGWKSVLRLPPASQLDAPFD
jgi:hypothetical protein